ncbi:tetratricopeptide repeat protein [Polaribacter aestuariivivens]|uniref:Tetratricopeptide repeat protein n=1 Tax=Polaribacter aestuariivivens TaxID=2304626 RepID=A0A5S3N0H0_9FLAO|nr:tetratricopeptide repeat protein [Polaribacter aestuariivivens]TMM28741.1 tetratricopeptide repeat protein [Polaribacter aestuariivivens]
MKKQILALSLGLMSVVAFSQKKELRVAEKAIKKQDYTAALAAANSVEGMLETMDSKYKAQYYFVKGQALAGKNKYAEAAEAFNKLFAYEKEIGRERYSKDAQPMLNKLIEKVSNLGADLYNKDKNYKEAAKNFYLTYKLSPKDTSFLYNAAVSASLAKDYDTSLEYYNELKDLGYTGISTLYVATNKETGAVENLGSKANRDAMVKIGQYINPTVQVTESKKAEIVKNIGYIYVNQGKTEEAITALQEARKSDPKDINLLMNEAQMYIKLEKMDKFGELMREAVALDPTNPILFYNLGVVNANEDKIEEAIGYYKKAIELDPKYGDAYLNLGVTILNQRVDVIEEMNENLSNDKKYTELEGKLRKICKEALPYLIEADKINRTENTVTSLMNIYDTLEMTDKADALRKVYKEMRGN